MGIILDSGGTEILLAFIGVLTLIYHFFTQDFNYWKDRNVPFVKPSPFFGNMKPMMTTKKSAAETFMDLYNSKELKGAKYGGAFMLRNPILIALDPEFIKDVLIKDFQHFSDRAFTLDEQKEPLNAHLFNLKGWRWRVLRTKLTQTFTSGKMKLMYGTMVDCAEGLSKLIEKVANSENGTIEIKEPLAKFTTDVIGTCAFGLQFNSMEDEEGEFRKMGRAIFTPNKSFQFQRLLILTFPIIVKYFNFSFLKTEISRFFLSVVDDTVKYREENGGGNRNDMMQLLIDIKKKGPIVDETDEKGRQVLVMDNKFIAAQAFVFFLAGFETSSTTMTFALYELARNPDIQEKLAQEIKQAATKDNGKITYDSIQEMKYLDMVVSETMRRFPIAQNLFRQVTKAYKVPDSDLILPEGMLVAIPIYAIHNDPKYYPNPDQFRPERFSPQEKANRHPMVYLPFGEGPRNCIGARFGLLQTKLGLVTILNKYKVDVCKQTIIPPELDPRTFFPSLKGGAMLKVTHRV